MLNTVTNILKGLLKERKRQHRNFPVISWIDEKRLKHQEDKKVKSISLAGYTIHYKRPYELLHAYREIFENEVYRFTSVNDAPVIFDCGSNIGISVLYFKKLYPKSRILAFEPDKNNFSILENNVSTNDLTNIFLHQSAVWIEDGHITFAANESEASHIVDTGGTSVKSERLRSLITREKTIDLLKMDIEGSEAQVLEDISDLLGRVSNFFLEYHGKVNETKKLTRIFSILEQSGYSVYIKNAADSLEHPFSSKSTGTIYDVQLNIFCYR